jgi:hypothetical protein
MAVKRKNPAAVALGRKGGKKGGLARAAKLTPEERSEIARKAVQARWDKANAKSGDSNPQGKAGSRSKVPEPREISPSGSSDRAVLALLARIKATDDPKEIHKLSAQLERAIFPQAVSGC